MNAAKVVATPLRNLAAQMEIDGYLPLVKWAEFYDHDPQDVRHALAVGGIKFKVRGGKRWLYLNSRPTAYLIRAKQAKQANEAQRKRTGRLSVCQPAIQLKRKNSKKT